MYIYDVFNDCLCLLHYAIIIDSEEKSNLTNLPECVYALTLNFITKSTFHCERCA